MRSLSASQQDEVKQLITMMKDPRYWRERDPNLIRTVRAGLRRIYLGEAMTERPDNQTTQSKRPRWLLQRPKPGSAEAADGC